MNRFPRTWLIWTTSILVFIGLQINLANLGNNLIPRNFVSWAGLVLTATGLIVWRLSQGSMRWPRWGVLWLTPALFVLVHSLVVPPSIPHYALLATGALTGFALWLWALGQVELDTRDWYDFAKLVWVGCLILVVLALPSANYWNRPEWIAWLPDVLRRAEGGFQQRNVFASFIAASMMWVWLLRLKAGGHPSAGLRGLFYSGLFLAAWMVMLSGSRTGSVSLLACFAGSIAYGVWIKADRKDLIGASIAVIAALLLSLYLPMGDLGDRIQDLQSGNSTRLRFSMWEVAYRAGWDAPWLGQGLGSFGPAFHDKHFQLVQQGAQLSYTHFLNHPHNETLLWWMETGGVGVVAVIGVWLVALVGLGIWGNPMAVPFVLAGLPIALHSQTEFPLHASGAHWWLAGLIAISFANPAHWKTRPIQIRLAWPVFVSAVGAVTTLVLLQAAYVSHQAWINGRYRFESSQDYVAGRAQHIELTHWVMGRQSIDFWTVSLANLAAKEGNVDLAEQLLPSLLDVQSRWQGPVVWNAVANMHALMGQTESLRDHIRWVSAFKPEQAQQIKQRLAANLDESPSP